MTRSKTSFHKSVIASLIILVLFELVVIVNEFIPLSRSIFGHTEVYEIEFIGEGNKWVFRYPGSDGELHTSDDLLITENENLVFPDNKSIYIRMKSRDLVYCLNIPELEKSQLALPGKDFTLEFDSYDLKSLSLVPGSLCSTPDKDLSRKILILADNEFDSWQSSTNTTPILNNF